VNHGQEKENRQLSPKNQDPDLTIESGSKMMQMRIQNQMQKTEHTGEGKGEDELAAALVSPGPGEHGEENAGDVDDEPLVELQLRHPLLIGTTQGGQPQTKEYPILSNSR